MSKLSIVNARIIDPASGYDDFGTILTEDGLIIEFGASVEAAGDIIDAGGHILSLIHI